MILDKITKIIQKNRRLRTIYEVIKFIKQLLKKIIKK